MNALKMISAALCCSTLLLSSNANADFRDCSDEQVNTIVAAAWTAELRLIGAGQELASLRSGGDRRHFEEWFGPMTTEHLDDVEAVLYAAWQGGLANANYYCGPTLFCNKPYAVAWTEHGVALEQDPPYGVYLCGPFWSQSNIEQAGILIHEYTHLYGTRDFTDAEIYLGSDYQDIARVVAQDDPNSAVTIAYNYGFYCTE